MNKLENIVDDVQEKAGCLSEFCEFVYQAAACLDEEALYSLPSILRFMSDESARLYELTGKLSVGGNANE